MRHTTVAVPVVSVLFAVAAATIVAGDAAQVAAGEQLPAHHWDFGSDGEVTDIGTRGSAAGRLHGGARVSGGALHLDGDSSWVELAGHLVPVSPPYTVSVYARASSGGLGGAPRDFISQGAPGASFYIGVGADGSTLRAGDNWAEVEARFVNDGEYHHYALVMGVNEAQFWVDGVLVASNAPYAGGAGGAPTRLGRGSEGGARSFNGSLDDVRIYDGELDEGAIAALAASALSPGSRADAQASASTRRR